MVVLSLLIVTLEAILLVCALSLDAFVASFAFGTQNIKIPFSSVTLINVICSCILAISLFLGAVVKPYLPGRTASFISFAILMFLGVSKLFDSFIKKKIKGRKAKGNRETPNGSNLDFILRVYADSTEADSDNSRTISAGEAVSLAIALSIDGLAAGFGTGITNVSYIQVVFFSLISDMVAVMSGCAIGRKVASKVNLDLSWLGGTMLIVLAFTKLF